MKMRVALIQFDVKPNDIKHNESVVREMITHCAGKADVVVLPELWNCGYDLKELPNNAQTLRGSSVSMLQKLAKEHGLWIFGGTIGEKKGNVFYNTMPIINSDGEIVEKYRKIHLYPYALHEEEYFEAGDEWCLVDTPWGRIGTMICYDLRFPELARNLTLRGAKTIIMCAQWPKARIEQYRCLVQARAIENQIYMCSCNRTGKDSSGTYNGNSMVAFSYGDVLVGGAEATEQGILLAELDYEELENRRNLLLDYTNRRSILDEIDDSQI